MAHDVQVVFVERRQLCLAASAAGVNNQSVVAECTISFVHNNANLTRLYEALLQSYLFAGFPAALESLTTFSSVLKELDVHFEAPAPEVYDVEGFRERGVRTCNEIYTNVYPQIRERLAVLSPQLDEWMIIEGYGKTLSRLQLDLLSRELINVAMLATCGWERQLYSHLRGALNVGATKENCEEALQCALRLKGEEVFSKAMNVLNRVQQSSRSSS